MNNKYNQIIEQVQLSNPMRERILGNVQSIEPVANSKASAFLGMRRYLSIAACFVFFVAGALLLPRLLAPPTQNPVVVSPNNPISIFSGAPELSEALGFRVEDVPSLPFNPDKTVYASYSGQLAEITYHLGNRKITYRKSLGTGDNSGVFEAFDEILEFSLGEYTVVLRGSQPDVLTLASWSDGQFSYSLYLDEGVSQQSWVQIILGIK